MTTGPATRLLHTPYSAIILESLKLIGIVLKSLPDVWLLQKIHAALQSLVLQ